MSKTRLLTQPHECVSTSFANGASELVERQRRANGAAELVERQREANGAAELGERQRRANGASELGGAAAQNEWRGSA